MIGKVTILQQHGGLDYQLGIGITRGYNGWTLYVYVGSCYFYVTKNKERT